MSNALTVNPFYAARVRRGTLDAAPQHASAASIEKRVIGNATLYRADCFDVLPQLAGIDAVVTDPPWGIGFRYRSCDDLPSEYDGLMRRLIPELVRITDNGPCFVWQSPLKAPRWHQYFPIGWRIIAACKLYPEHLTGPACLSWDPIIFWSGRSLLKHELPRDWYVADLRPWDGYRGGNPVPCPRPLEQVRYICDSVQADSILDPFMGAAPLASPPSWPASGSSALNATRCISSTPAGGLRRCGMNIAMQPSHSEGGPAFVPQFSIPRDNLAPCTMSCV